MSLISDALKKAQKMRSLESSAAGMGAGRRGRELGPQAIIAIVAGAIVLVAAAVVTTLLLINGGSDLAESKAAPAAPATNAQVLVAPPAQQPAPPATPPPAPAVIVLPAPAVTTVRPPLGDPAAGAPATPASTSRVTASDERTPYVAPKAGPDVRIQTFVDSLKITGTRAAATPSESRVMINDSIYRINQVVERNFNLRLVEIATNRLTFVDEQGNRYVKEQ